jgi:alanyl-tRNA synthetase
VIGTERVAMILQGVESVFQIDGYRSTMATIRSFVDASGLPESTIVASERVIADYLKALYVLVGDGAPPPGKNGREQIIKLLIRGVVTRQILLGIQSDDFLPAVIERIDQSLQQDLRAALKDERVLIAYFESESERFGKTIRRGRRALGAMLKENAGQTLTGQQILDLEKRKGLPHLLTARFLKEKGLEFLKSDYLAALGKWETLLLD